MNLIKRFINFKYDDILNTKSIKYALIDHIYQNYNIKSLIINFTFIDSKEVKKSNTEDDFFSMIDENKLVFNMCDFEYDIIKNINPFLDDNFFRLLGLFNSFIMGNYEYSKYVKLLHRTKNKISSNYNNLTADKSKYYKKMEFIFMSLEEIGVPIKDIFINQVAWSDGSYFPYVKIEIKLNNDKLHKLIDIIWDEKIEIPVLLGD